MSAAIQLDLWVTAAPEKRAPQRAANPVGCKTSSPLRRPPGENRHGEEPPVGVAPAAAAEKKSKPAVVQQLRQQLRRMESAGQSGGSVTSTGADALDALLPDRGLAAGTITEWVGDPASGAGWLALFAARNALQQRGGQLVVLDPAADVYPPTLLAAGIPAERLVILRPSTRADLVWAIDQTLRCPAVAAVWGSIDRMDDRQQRRLQLAAETGGGLGLFVRPLRSLSQPSWATVRFQVQPHQGAGQRRMHVRVVRAAGAPRGAAVLLEIDGAQGGRLQRCEAPAAPRRAGTAPFRPSDQEPRDGTSALHLAAELAHPAAARKRARRTA